MGQGASGRAAQGAVKDAAAQFTSDEQAWIRSTWRDLVSRGPNGTAVDKDTFLKVFPLPGLLGEQLFNVFDRNGQHTLTWEEFLGGLATVCRGSRAARHGFVHAMFDMGGCGAVSEADCATLLAHIPEQVFAAIYAERFGAGASPPNGERLHTQRVARVTRSLFETFNAAGDGKLTREEFSACLSSHPGILTYLTSVFPFGETAGGAAAPATRSTGMRRRSVNGAVKGGSVGSTSTAGVPESALPPAPPPVGRAVSAPASDTGTSPPALLARATSTPAGPPAAPPVVAAGSAVLPAGLDMLVPALASTSAALRAQGRGGTGHASAASAGLACAACGFVLRHDAGSGMPLSAAAWDAVFKAGEGWLLTHRPRSASGEGGGAPAPAAPPKSGKGKGRAGTPPPTRVGGAEPGRMPRRSVATLVIHEREREDSDSPHVDLGGASPPALGRKGAGPSTLSRPSTSALPAAAVRVPAARDARSPARRPSLEEAALTGERAGMGIAFATPRGSPGRTSPGMPPPPSPALAEAGSSGSRPPTAPSPGGCGAAEPPAPPALALPRVGSGISLPARNPGHDLFGPVPARRPGGVLRHRACVACGAAHGPDDWRPLPPAAVAWVNLAGLLAGSGSPTAPRSAPGSPFQSPLASHMRPPPGVDMSAAWDAESTRGDDAGSVGAAERSPLFRALRSGRGRGRSGSDASDNTPTGAVGVGFVSGGGSSPGAGPAESGSPLWGALAGDAPPAPPAGFALPPPAAGGSAPSAAQAHAQLAAAHLQWLMHHAGVPQGTAGPAHTRQRSLSVGSGDSGGSMEVDRGSVDGERVRSMSQSDALGRGGRVLDDILVMPTPLAEESAPTPLDSPDGPLRTVTGTLASPPVFSGRHASSSSLGGRSAATEAEAGAPREAGRARSGSYGGPGHLETDLLPPGAASAMRHAYTPWAHHPADEVHAVLSAAAHAASALQAGGSAPPVAVPGASAPPPAPAATAAGAPAAAPRSALAPPDVLAATLAASGHVAEEVAGSVASAAAVGEGQSVRSGAVDGDGLSVTAPATAGGGAMAGLGAGAARTLALHGAEMLEHEGELWKMGRRTGVMTRRWYYLCQNFLYWYADQQTHTPKGSLFLEGSYVFPCNDQMSKGYFGIKIHTASAHGDQERVLYCTSARERDEWMSVLTRACRTVVFEEVYRLVRELGQGRFSRVVEAAHRESGAVFAVKVINKSELKPEERELLRTEIAILRLVQHPHIIRLEDVFETSSTMYIVMELITGGELFDNIIGRSRFGEDEARDLVKPLVDAVAYLHSLGIVHRDIKPENILCGDKVHDCKIADFGLSKLVHRTEVMTMPCGTLTYVAPEVLSMQGYHMEADMWSVGVIMYLVVRGKLPFDGQEQQVVVDRILHEPLDFSSGVWRKWSTGGVDFIRRLLEKNPAKRLTARQALQHPWLRKRPAAADADAGAGSGAAAWPTA